MSPRQTQRRQDKPVQARTANEKPQGCSPLSGVNQGSFNSQHWQQPYFFSHGVPVVSQALIRKHKPVFLPLQNKTRDLFTQCCLPEPGATVLSGWYISKLGQWHFSTFPLIPSQSIGILLFLSGLFVLFFPFPWTNQLNSILIPFSTAQDST